MQSRRKVREMALKTLYSMVLCEDIVAEWLPYAERIYYLEQEYRLDKEGNPIDHTVNDEVSDEREYVPSFQPDPLLTRLLTFTLHHLGDIDKQISETLKNWQPDRINIVDRCALRLGISELIYCPDTPRGVTINEWLEIVRSYSVDNAPAFINGILDQVNRPSREAKNPH
ncbi:MAG: transcription antitermination factor NusB [Candidatus Cloacimonetes bacterium 4572_55]|nr:MAG: transcription antitermination factor NusB [Candidatus Cloacimonetes bacterium 4572_55]